jgi:hypothetical protein
MQIISISPVHCTVHPPQLSAITNILRKKKKKKKKKKREKSKSTKELFCYFKTMLLFLVEQENINKAATVHARMDFNGFH